MVDPINGSSRRSDPSKEEKSGPRDFVVVLAYTSDDGEIEESFGQLVEDIKALYTFKKNVRAYALVDRAAKNVLSKVEKPKESTNRAVMVISWPQPGEMDEAFQKLSEAADKVRPMFAAEDEVRVDVAIREAADEVLSVFPRTGE